MLSKFLATTAVSALLVMPAYASSHDDDSMEPPAAMDSGTMEPETEGQAADDPLADTGETLATDEAADEAAEDAMESPMMADVSAEEVIGADVLSFDEETIATVDDVVMSPDGSIDYVLVDIGGFLGIGARTVAIPFADVTFQTDADGSAQVLTALSESDLENMPEYEG